MTITPTHHPMCLGEGLPSCTCGAADPVEIADSTARHLRELEKQLAASAAHENELLNQVSAAHTAGYSAALVQVRDLLEVAAATADDTSADLPGLRVALHLLDRARATAHRVALTIGRRSVAVHVECTADVGAPCRLTCQGAVEGRCDLVCSCEEPSIVDGGRCQPAAWFNDYDPADFLDAYVGPPGRELASAPIAVRWCAREQDWQWMFVADLPDGVTDEEWCRAQA